MTGVAVTARIIFRACPPSRSGRPRSRTITSGGCWLTSLIPSSAVPAVRTACARRVRSAAIADRTYGSSSTMSTRAMTGTRMHSKPGLRHYCRHDAGPDRPGRLAGRHRPRGRPGLVRREHGGQRRRDEPRRAGDQRRARIRRVPPPTTPPTSPARRLVRSGRVGQPGARASRARSAATSSPSPSTTPSAAPAGTVRSYTLAGGRVTLDVSGDSAALVTAMPDSGFSVADLVRHGLAAGRLQLRRAGVIADRQLVPARADRHRRELTRSVTIAGATRIRRSGPRQADRPSPPRREWLPRRTGICAITYSNCVDSESHQ